MKTTTVASLALAVLAAGCAHSSGAIQTGGDSFTITTSASPGRGGVPAAKRAAYEEAGAECARRGRKLELADERFTSPSWTEGMAVATLTFRCVVA